MKNIFGIIIIALSIFSCDNVDCPNEIDCIEPIIDTNCVNSIGIDTCLLPGNITVIESDTTTYKKIFLEEFTGFKCTTCPKGAREIESLIAEFKDTLVTISIHSGFFAVPEGDNYVTDFRTAAGDEYDALFTPTSNPTAVIDKKKFSGNYQQGRDDWQSIIRDEINNAPVLIPQIKLISFYSADKKTVLVKSNIIFPEATTTNYSFIFLVIEDHVIDIQLDDGVIIEDYDHRHVLRSAIIKALGTKINTGAISANEIIEVFSDYLELNADWNIDNLEIIGVLYDSETLEVEQVQTVHLH